MCGRFATDRRVNEEVTEFVERAGRLPAGWHPDWQPSWNIAPTAQVPLLIDSARTSELHFGPARWSLVPAWSDTLTLKYPTFNARAETLASKATWRRPLRTHRAIVLAHGYYEWTGPKGRKQPWFIRYPNHRLMGFAGLYEWWPDRSKPDDDPARWVLTATIVTSDAVQTLADIHDRNPVVLPQDMWLHWLDPTLEGDQELVDEAVHAGIADAAGLTFDAVAPFGTTANGPDLIRPLPTKITPEGSAPPGDR